MSLPLANDEGSILPSSIAMRMGNHNGGAAAARRTDGAEEIGVAEAEIALGLEPLVPSAPQPG